MVAKLSTESQQPPETKDDIDLEHRLVNFLDARHVPGRELVHLDVHGGTVIVRGPLHSAREKWLCIECCRHVAGVIKLVDEIVVELPRQRTRSNGTQPPASARVSRTAPRICEIR